jgi:hypothetical protein
VSAISSRKGTQVSHVNGVFRRNDEAEVAAIFLTSLDEATFVGDVGSRIEHAGVRAIPFRTVP